MLLCLHIEPLHVGSTYHGTTYIRTSAYEFSTLMQKVLVYKIYWCLENCSLPKTGVGIRASGLHASSHAVALTVAAADAV